MHHPSRTIVRFVAVALSGLCLLLISAAAAAPAAAATPLTTTTPPDSIYLPLVTRDHDPSWQWEAPSPVLIPVPPVATNTLPVAATDRQGQVHLFWAVKASAPEGKYIYHSTLTRAGWTAPAPILPTLGTSYSPFTPVVGPDGALHLFWLNKLTSDGTPRLLYSAYRDGTWATEEVVFDYPAWGIYDVRASAVGRVALDGQVYALVHYIISNLHTYQARRTGSDWQAQVVPDTGVLDLNDWLLGDRDGAVRRFISRYENSAYRGFYSYWLDGAYLIKDTPLPFVPRNTHGRLDGGNYLHVYWRAEVPVPGGQVIGLYHQCFDPAMAPAGEPELLTGREATTASLLPSADEAGRWTLAWQMAATGEAKIGVWHGCRQEKTVSVPADPATPWPPFQALFSQAPNRWCGVWKASAAGYLVRCADIAAP